MGLSERVLQIRSSVTSEILERVNQLREGGKDIVSFGAGELDCHTPQKIKDAAKDAIDNNLTRYTPVTGIKTLKEAIRNKLERENHLNYEIDQIVISNGAKHALYNVIQTIINPGDEVIIPLPYWVSYTEMVRLAGGIPVFVESSIEDGFMLRSTEIEKMVTPKTKAIILNNPNNPTGAVIEPYELKKIGELACKYDFHVISDEVYEGILYERETISIATISEEVKQRTIIINSMSKGHAMTGWRIGYMAAPKDIARYAGIVQGHNASNANSIAQAASITALTKANTFLYEMKEELTIRRDYMYSELSKIPGFKLPPKPAGAFYLFVNIEEFKMDSLDFSKFLLDHAHVAVTPGIAFGKEHFVRFSYACSMPDIIKGIEKIKACLHSENIMHAS
ncbi:pyridoxal phosphate-dependent aminotransferase [Bacillus sp. SM2101]|uniref:pyridoxal phosphate-dependent aminotransferase n=1 Tax=Bacillus sp. SM2101 TaxID=2805366 RepID=UPI001BDE1DA6|nr:pyridoxal phosphate-dependent aminotransferase [Bacillus sp. SM2101]